MDDDFNSAQAIAVIFDLIRTGNKIIDGNEKNNSQFYYLIKKFLNETADVVLGIINFETLKKSHEKTIEDDLVKLLIEIRDEMKKQKNFELSDKIRKDLFELGIILQDNKTGTEFKRK
jgi:cysteinyl-tRNA synthetase